jgi:hypothetical protein
MSQMQSVFAPCTEQNDAVDQSRMSPIFAPLRQWIQWQYRMRHFHKNKNSAAAFVAVDLLL